MTSARNWRSKLLVLVGLGWAASVGFGTLAVARYENTSGVAGEPPIGWPIHTRIPRHDDRFTLVMFAHPDCPCTRASLEELTTLITETQGKLEVFIEIDKPGMTFKEARASEIWRDAGRIPGITVLADLDGAERRRFDAAVSGQAVLYDRDGRLVFSGGITGARGHVGDNPGVDAVLLRVGGRDAPLHTPVFGCSLLDPDEAELSRDAAWKKL